MDHGPLAITNAFMREMSDISSTDHRVIVTVTTDRPWAIDEAFYRRFDHKIHVPLPDKATLR